MQFHYLSKRLLVNVLCLKSSFHSYTIYMYLVANIRERELFTNIKCQKNFCYFLGVILK